MSDFEIASRVIRRFPLVPEGPGHALAPTCVDKFRPYSWDKGTYVSAGGWATSRGSSEPNWTLAQACCEMLINVGKQRYLPVAQPTTRHPGGPPAMRPAR